MAPPAGSRAAPGGSRLRVPSSARLRGSASRRRPGTSRKGGRAAGAGGGDRGGCGGGPAIAAAAAAAGEPGEWAPGLGTPRSQSRLSEDKALWPPLRPTLRRTKDESRHVPIPLPARGGPGAPGGGREVGEAPVAPPLAPSPGAGQRAVPAPAPSARPPLEGGAAPHVTLPLLRSEPPLSPPSRENHRLPCHRRHLARRAAARRGRWAVRGLCARGAPDVPSPPPPVTQPQPGRDWAASPMLRGRP